MKVVVLSGKYAETKRFVAAMNLPPHTPHIVNADRLRGIGGRDFATEVHILPSYFERRDQGAIENMLRGAERRGNVARRFWSQAPDGRWLADGGDLQSFPNGELYATAPLTVEEVRERHARPWSDVRAEAEAAGLVEPRHAVTDEDVIEAIEEALDAEDPTDDDLEQRFGVAEQAPQPEIEHDDFLAWLEDES